MVKLKIDGLEAECEVEEAIEILLALKEKERREPQWIPLGKYKIPVQPDPHLPPYTITCGGTVYTLKSHEQKSGRESYGS